MSLATGVYNFGIGQMFGRSTSVATPTPVHFGVVQDVQITVDRTLKGLVGQNQFPVDVAVGEGKITGSAKNAQFDIAAFNSLFIGQTLTSAAGNQVATDEAHTIPSTPFQVTIAPPGTTPVFVRDYGVVYSTGGRLTRVASGPTTGQYSVTEPGGVYTFAAADTALVVLISYYYTVATVSMNEIVVANQIMGSGPTFELFLQNSYANNVGTVNPFNLRLHAVRAGKIDLPFKNTDYTILGWDFQAFADTSGNLYTLSGI